MPEEPLTPKKGFLVIEIGTNRVLYEGNSLLKTIEHMFCGAETEVVFAHPMNIMLLKHAIAMQERLN